MVTIRPAQPVDLDSLVELLKTLFAIEADFTFDEPVQQRGLSMVMESERACLLVAEEEGAVIGMCSGQLTISTAEGGPALLVEDVVVRAEWRGRGIARRLLDNIGAWAEGQGASRLQLLADRNNGQALAFYRHLGWRTTELVCLRKRTAR